MNRAQDSAVAAVVEASQLFRSNGNEQKVEVFVNLARRLQSLVHREIQILDELENQVEDPDLLKGLFHVDHLATRIRRHAENLAVLGGAVSRRQWSSPVTMTEVLRSAIAEVEQYPRVKLVPPIDGTLRGHAVADVIHLLAELVENATVFSAPHTQVLLRAQRVTAGLALEVEDRGLGMPGPEQKRMNTLLADPDQVNVAHLLQDGRIGLFVVASLARRHGIAVRLQSNIYGGTQAVLVLPEVLLGIDIESTTAPDAAPAPSPGTVHLPPARGAATPAPAQVTAEPSPERAPGGDGQGGGPPLPLRAERVDRPNPAASPPVARTVQPDPAPVPVPFGGPVPPAGAVESAPPRTDAPAPAPAAETRPARPQLPRRSNQEHLAPQLREAPVRRTEDENVLHDPGLMAAFRRGVDLAEAQTAEERETAHPYGAPGAVPATGPVPSVGAQRSHGLAPLPLRAPTTTATAARARCTGPRRHPNRIPGPATPSRSRRIMTSEMPSGQVSDLDWLLSGLVQRVPYTRSAVLLSADGLVKSVHGMDADSADHMAALAAGLYSLGRSAGARFGDNGDVRQVVVELDSTLLFVSTAGSGTCLAVLAGREADAAVLGYEMAMLVKSVRPYLMTPLRQPAGAPFTPGL